ncbi:C2H2-type zinc finger protein [Endozoicomonas sp. 4G]|uniref:C2H2-type zinc finger protein n=1 Tax=Endozoicomonas sp. 4G TaxID=2872754 RepID=UPI00207871AB|nr:C2H2-type zinc finger protein [Endozoicomonas sp. 4G]
MLSNKTLILIFTMVFSVHSSNGHAQEKQLCLGNNQPTRIRLLLDEHLKIVLHPPGVENRLLPLLEESETIEWWELKQEFEENHGDMPRVCFGDGILLKPDTRYCFSPDSGVETLAHSRADSDEGSGSEDSGTSDENSGNRSDEDETDTETDVQCVHTRVSPFRALDETSQFCVMLALEMIQQAFISNNEILTEPEADVTKAESVNHLKVTSPVYNTDRMRHLKTHKQKQLRLPANQRPKVHQCDHEGCDYSTNRAANLRMHKQTHLSADQRTRVHQCDHEGCDYSTNRAANLRMHKQTHLSADQRIRVHQCDHEGCDYSAFWSSNLNAHKQTHLPADQRPKVHQCDHEGCDYSTNRSNNLKAHKQIHLPTDQRPKEHHCDHEGCDYSTNRAASLRMHKQTHLPADQRPKMHQCDHEGCHYITNRLSNLKKHKRIHLPTDQRPERIKRKAYGQPPSNKKRKKDYKEWSASQPASNSTLQNVSYKKWGLKLEK